MNILFYSSVEDVNLFNIQRFYKVDIDILESLGHTVILSNKFIDAVCFWKYDIIFCYFYRWSFFSALTAKLFKKKVYFTGGIDNLDKSYANAKDYNRQKFFFKLCYSVSDICFIVSEADLCNIKNIYGNNKRLDKLVVSEHTIEVSSFIKQEYDKQKIFSTIVWMGNESNVKRKGVDKAIELFNFLIKKPEFIGYKFVIVGQVGDGTNYLKQIARTYNIEDQIIFTGAIDENSKIEILQNSRYYFQLSKYEGFGLAALEAFFAKCIVIHSGKGAMCYTLKDRGVCCDIDSNLDSDMIYDLLLNYNIDDMDHKISISREYYSNDRRKRDFEDFIKL